MKHIFFIRHAKSSWDDFSLRDHDRPLNNRGKRDAPKMASRLADLGIRPDGILTSTAKRAVATAKAFREAFGLGKEDILKQTGLYHAMPEDIEAEMQLLPKEWDTVLVFGHNPGHTYLANSLQHESTIDNVPTCGIVSAESNVTDWNDFRIGEARRVGFMYPKDGR